MCCGMSDACFMTHILSVWTVRRGKKAEPWIEERALQAGQPIEFFPPVIRSYGTVIGPGVLGRGDVMSQSP